MDNREIVQGYEEILAAQDQTACELAFQAVETRDTGILSWFTAEVLDLDAAEFIDYVSMALLEKLKGGDYKWRASRNPIAYLKTLAIRAHKRWKSERWSEGYEDDSDLLGDRTGYMDPAPGILIRRGLSNDGRGFYVVKARGDEPLKKRPRRREASKIAEKTVIVDGKEYVVPIFASPRRETRRRGLKLGRRSDSPKICYQALPEDRELDTAWERIAQEFGLDEDETTLLRARMREIKWAEVGTELQWDSRRVERTRKRLERKMGKFDNRRALAPIERSLRVDRLKSEIVGDSDNLGPAELQELQWMMEDRFYDEGDFGRVTPNRGGDRGPSEAELAIRAHQRER